MDDRVVEAPFQLDIESLFRFLYDLITNSYGGDVVAFLKTTWDFANFISIFLAPLFLFGIVYAVIRLHQIHKADHEQFEEAVRNVGAAEKGNTRWDRVMDLVSGDNPHEWRQAIIDADALLDGLLIERGYVGSTLGERLKTVAPEQMSSLNAAWEAHKVRNEIAHAGSDFILTQREARRAIDNYRQVFSELNVL